jgi:hypothetical protein
MITVVASREGLIGGLTAAGLTIREDSLFVALPARRALWRTVRVVRRPTATSARSVICPVLDLGPWFPFRSYPDDEAYVFGGARPRAETMRGQVREGDAKKYPINGAGIDLSDAVIEALGFRPEEWGLREVEWEFVE